MTPSQLQQTQSSSWSKSRQRDRETSIFERQRQIKEKSRRYPVFDRLNKAYLTRSALRELDLRNSLRPCSAAAVPDPSTYTDLLLLANRGGPDLQSIRRCFQASTTSSPSSAGEDPSPSGRQRDKRVPPADANFDGILADYNIFLQFHEFSDRTTLPKPANLAQIRDYISRPRQCPSLADLTEDDFLVFCRESLAASEGTVMTKAVQTLVGPGRISSECNSVTFHNLESMTGGVTTQPNPDLFDGALLGDVDAGIREKLDGQIIPSKNARACWDGAHGARAIQALQNVGDEEEGYHEIFDGNAYTYSATFCGGVLEVFAHFVRPSRVPDRRREYHMTLLASISMKDGVARFIEGASILRNTRDLAKLQRDNIIRAANTKQRKATKLSDNLC
ncbi:hypothetical protein NQ176_g4275 [Zarea fungicola]|uniref:Uncharacterized protein n=1 Tax=Zarea fungicola TaxID=93591 RepID=A0ACC1NGY1_9HYPO|nr:hypothetical protein NQ176_g4275 [Lecanicillium fungicola]